MHEGSAVRLGAIWYAMWLRQHDQAAHRIGSAVPLTATLDYAACRRNYQRLWAETTRWAEVNRAACALIHREAPGRGG